MTMTRTGKERRRRRIKTTTIRHDTPCRFPTRPGSWRLVSAQNRLKMHENIPQMPQDTPQNVTKKRATTHVETSATAAEGPTAPQMPPQMPLFPSTRAATSSHPVGLCAAEGAFSVLLVVSSTGDRWPGFVLLVYGRRRSRLAVVLLDALFSLQRLPFLPLAPP